MIMVKEYLTTFWNNRRARIRDYVGLFLLCLILFVNPIRTGMTRIACLLLFAVVWGYGAALFWNVVCVRLMHAIVIILALAIMLSPARRYDRQRLTLEYVRTLKTYTGVKYVWGGENGLGIDCSGLVREGMIAASIKYGCQTMNPGLIRNGFDLWWHDCTANTLGEGYHGRTYSVAMVDSLSGMNYSQIRKGDIAVTDSGVHTMAYLGDGRWIEADPGAGKVIQVYAPGSKNAWFGMPMKILRWQVL